MKKRLIYLFLFLIVTFFLISFLMDKNKLSFVSSFLTNKQIQNIKKYVFPYKYIAQQKNKIDELEQFISPLELEMVYRSLPDIPLKKIKNRKLSNEYVMHKYLLSKGFYFGINLEHSGSGYLDFHNDNLVVLSVRGVLAYSNNFPNNLKLKQIKNNIDKFINLNQFKKSHKYSLKDLLIHENMIFISFTEEIKKDCWNTSVIYSDFDYQEIEFKKLFSNKECVHSINNIDNEFEPLQSGGRIINFDNENILLTVGDYRSRFLAQDKESANGKIIKINYNDFEYEIFTMGHRNPQGLLFDKQNNFILETEHGPDGGDEINLIELDRIIKDNPLNYGWAISSAGEHYGDKNKNINKYKKYPLYKSHSKYGFIEPLKSFTPSIGISEIVKISKNKYVLSSLKDQSLYFFELKNKNIRNLERVEVNERVRDLFFKNDKLYLFMEGSGSIGVIYLKF
jgi:hypothetical protein